MTWLAFGSGMVVGALIAATYWATQYWESQRRLDEAVARAGRMVSDIDAQEWELQVARCELKRSSEDREATGRENVRLKELLNQTQNMLMSRNRQLDGIKEVLTEGDSDDFR